MILGVFFKKLVYFCYTCKGFLQHRITHPSNLDKCYLFFTFSVIKNDGSVVAAVLLFDIHGLDAFGRYFCIFYIMDCFKLHKFALFNPELSLFFLLLEIGCWFFVFLFKYVLNVNDTRASKFCLLIW